MAPLLFSLVFGLVEFGTMYGDWISLRQGVREAARQGSVANFGPVATCALTFAGGGSAPSQDMKNLMCLAKHQIGLKEADTRMKVLLADPALQNGGQSWAVGNGLIVCAEVPVQSVTGFFNLLFSGRYLKSKTAMRIEQLPNPSTLTETAGYEANPAPAGWSWCSASSVSP